MGFHLYIKNNRTLHFVTNVSICLLKESLSLIKFPENLVKGLGCSKELVNSLVVAMHLQQQHNHYICTRDLESPLCIKKNQPQCFEYYPA